MTPERLAELEATPRAVFTNAMRAELIAEIRRLTSPRHGVARYDNHGCRCEVCRAAKAEGMRTWRRRNKERRLPVVLDAGPTYVSPNQAAQA